MVVQNDDGLPPQVAALIEKAKFYTSLCLGTTAILSVFAFLFLIPFVVDPSITTIMSDYEPEPITCVTASHIYAVGITNCSWSSCKEGCTTGALRCHQILVNYSKVPFKEWNQVDIESVEWDMVETRFLINTEGCGYPPRVNCSIFAEKFGRNREPYPCYYSRIYPEMVVAYYSWEDNLKHLVLALIVPNALFGVCVGVLSYWYCPSCSKKTYVETFPSEEEEKDNDEDEFYENEDY